MDKFLYITDQNEFTDHSFIGPLFQKYLQKYFDVKTIFFSKYKYDSEIKADGVIVIPQKYKKSLFEELETIGISLDDFQFVVIRNDMTLLKSILSKGKRNFKLGFRLSFPKRIAKIQENEAKNRKSFFDTINNKIQAFSETNLINQCDIFLPTSFKMKNEHFKDVNTKSFPIPSAIDPENLHENIQHESIEKRFFYAGTLDRLREFGTILKAFEKLDSSKYKIMISTKDPEYLNGLLENFSHIKDNIEVYNAQNKEELLDLIAKADIGLATLPDIDLFNNATPMKVIDYYSSAIPCVMTNNEYNNAVFEHNSDAWLVDFNEKALKKELEYIISLSKDEIAQIGLKGQKKLLEVRNYEKIAKELAQKLNIL